MNFISAILLKEHPISGCIQDKSGNPKPFPILAIDEIPLNIWINKNTNIIEEANTLVPAQGWLYDFENNLSLSNAWKLLEPQASESGAVSTVVPILICPDDLDLVCSVIMVEQVVTETEVTWIRFGRSWNHIHDLVTSVIWENPFASPVLTFKLSDFEEAYNNLKSFDKVWNGII
ncbi:hypothetical protein [Acinetobacter bereziniae]|uniref:hypothetical protein n=1 Tax=Acinetobacter bereziniae TaxID=106648 RepID=UPI001ABC98B2|nr:hypothetical protein [Acinetobacter bereziniae]MBO3656008.1 hypothetical protein [Acinetobacter bereziniae]